MLQCFIPLSCRPLPTEQHTQETPTAYKHLVLAILWEDETTVRECLHVVKSSGKSNVWPVSRQEPLDGTACHQINCFVLEKKKRRT